MWWPLYLWVCQVSLVTMWNGGWCRDDWSASCSTSTANFTIQDHSLCSNTTFWSTVSCNVYWKRGQVLAYGKRCSANKQHCYYPWYTKNTKDFEDYKATFLQTCQDNSDRIFAMNTRCNITGYVKQYCDTICNETNKHYACKENICENPTEWISEQTDPFILDPQDCESSCLNPSQGCDACTFQLHQVRSLYPQRPSLWWTQALSARRRWRLWFLPSNIHWE